MVSRRRATRSSKSADRFDAERVEQREGVRADRVVDRVAEKPLSGRAHEPEAPVGVENDNHVEFGLGHRAELRQIGTVTVRRCHLE